MIDYIITFRVNQQGQDRLRERVPSPLFDSQGKGSYRFFKHNIMSHFRFVLLVDTKVPTLLEILNIAAVVNFLVMHMYLSLNSGYLKNLD